MELAPKPPPLPPAKVNNTEIKIDVTITRNPKITYCECLWAADNLNIQRACFFSKICTRNPPLECSYLNVDPILQIGPTCGLVACSMLFSGHPSLKVMTPERLLETAKNLKFTFNGEMFSAQWMLELIQKSILKSELLANDSENIHAYIHDGSLDSDLIRSKLRSNCFILVSYDADKNHKPCNANGWKAHWALTCGYLIDDNKEFHVFVRHGKTRNVALFSLSQLSNSNSNLNEFSQPAMHPNDEFCLPVGGISGCYGLKNKCVIVEGISCYEVVKM